MDRRILSVFLSIIVSTPIVAETVPTYGSEYFRVPSARLAAIGGPHAALADDFTVLFSNPAGFSAVAPGYRVSDLTFSVAGPVFTIAGITINAMNNDLEDVFSSPELAALLSSLHTGARIGGPLSFGWVGNGLGFGAMNVTGFTLDTSSTGSVKLEAYERFLFMGGVSYEMHLPTVTPSSISGGFLLKTFIEGRSRIATSILGLPSVIEGFGPDLFDNHPFDLASGLGIDVGVRYSFRDMFVIGVTGQNVYAPVGTNRFSGLDAFLGSDPPVDVFSSRVPFDLSVGVMLRPPLGALRWYIDDLAVFFDYRDILDFVFREESSRNIVLKLSRGVELRLLQVLLVRAALADGLLAAGLGIDLGAVRFDAAMFGRELSTEPGMRPVYNIALGLEFRL
ncbi:MAG: hypothetical protein EA426_14105 [Spirochaetaceae bacterium]|nr:MAG: hypothetical protein EA426_14105 [Spirochaetaceae bacterium]